MDDLDHSMHIAEYDWTSFYVDSEECGLLQPLLACPDHSTLSDSEDSGKSSPVFIKGQVEPRQSRDENSEKPDSKALWCTGKVQINLSSLRKDEDDLNTKTEEDSDTRVNCEIGLDCPEGNSTNIEEVRLIWSAEHITEDTHDDIAAAVGTEQMDVQSLHGEAVELKKDNGGLQTKSDTCELKPIQKPDPLSCNQTEVIVNEPQSTDRAEGEEVSGVSLRAERERWFVTINDSPARPRVHSKKKRRQKKPCKEGHMCRGSRQENSNNISFKQEGNKDGNESGGGGDISDSYRVLKENPERITAKIISDSSQASSTSGDEDSPSEKLKLFHSVKENSTLHNVFTFKGPPQLDSAESEDGAEFFSTHSYDSESYQSAAESIDEPRYLQSLQSSVPLTQNSCPLLLMGNTNADDTQVTKMPFNDSTVSSNPTATNADGHDRADVEPPQMFQSVGQSVNKMPDEDSVCVNDGLSTMPCVSSDPSGVQKHEINLPASACSSGNQHNLSSVPDLTVTPCAAADSPETYAEAAGHTRPVYAISAFWDEMEKLTINDILQLRMGRSPPSRETQETVTQIVDDFPSNPSSLAETMEYGLCSGGLTDPDNADSDYFTQVDESKPDRSSCEFSTSDFEEEYWQFLDASRNPSPDPQSKFQQGTRDTPYFEEEESTCSEGKETPVPAENFVEPLFEDQDSKVFNSSEHVWSRQIPKSKSVFDVPALTMEDSSLQLIVGHDDSNLSFSSCPSLEGDVALDESDSLGILLPPDFLSNTQVLDEISQISFPEVFENLFKDQTKRDSCVTVYHPESFPLATAFDGILSTFRDETPLSSCHDFQCSDKPIPIFSCSHPTVRELTFPNPDYIFSSSEHKESNDISPIRVVLHSFIQKGHFGTSAFALSGSPSLLSMRKICFPNKGSIWCGSSGTWVFPVEATDNTMTRDDPPLTAFAEGSVPETPARLFRKLAVQQRILGPIQTRRECIFSALKQSDMCLVCIAFASWVLRSSDPEAADTWKAALLANVSALSAIQYLRHYVKKNPSQGDP
ncbi:uncharacterized protein si:ch211-157b11.14 [Xyrichtys novacula]|uniref:Uncharacterized protein si:ch211-157b11.14 n=1 Tax=Xyrichtys novacula TaxID=13765 RepID=A0AAV1EQ40_XYRNO|nr:uncharacterized protein si:ch211-157b11.14 [Xyrichtys novacula]